MTPSDPKIDAYSRVFSRESLREREPALAASRDLSPACTLERVERFPAHAALLCGSGVRGFTVDTTGVGTLP